MLLSVEVKVKVMRSDPVLPPVDVTPHDLGELDYPGVSPAGHVAVDDFLEKGQSALLLDQAAIFRWKKNSRKKIY